MNQLKSLLIVLFVLSVPLVTVLGAFKFTAFNMYFYEEQFEKNDLDIEDAVEISASTLTFLKDKDAGMSLISDYTPTEQEHLTEVRDVMHRFLCVFYIALSIMILTAILLYLIDKKEFTSNISLALFYGGGYSAITISLFLFLIFMGFDSVFAYFHEMFFTSVWQFPASSLLIRLFPRVFFVDVITKIIIGAYVTSMFFNLSGLYLAKKERYKLKRR